MSSSGAQAAAFYRDVAQGQRLWTIRDKRGFPAPKGAGGFRAQPFWSSLSRVQKIIRTVPAYARFEPVEIPWTEFRDRVLPDLRRSKLRVGVNWSGPAASGFDLDPDWVQHSVEVEIENLGGPPATPLEEVRGARGGVFHRLLRRD